MKLVLSLFVLLGPIFLQGCVTAPTPQQQMYAYYGPYPDDYEAIIKDYMSRRLKDPSSATYNFNAIPTKGWAGGGIGRSVQYGYRICVLINAKNSYGGYTGARKHFFMILDNQVVKAEDIDIFTEGACPGSW